MKVIINKSEVRDIESVKEYIKNTLLSITNDLTIEIIEDN